MNPFITILLISSLNYTTPIFLNDSTQTDDYKIARAMRKAVRDADLELLNSTVLGSWRDYLKIAVMDLNMQLQPLALIRFDEDISFRNQLKTLIDWEAKCEKKETEHYIYYYRWDHPIPELLLDIQEVHFKEISSRFSLEFDEKIPFRYDPNVEKSKVYPFDDLRGGVVSSQPLDLEKATLAMLNSINSELTFITTPLSRIYGSFFQNQATSQAYYRKCLQEIKAKGYVSALNLFAEPGFENFNTKEWYSSYAFVYTLHQQYGPQKIAKFLSKASTQSKKDFQDSFEDTFEIDLQEFENKNEFYQSVNKL